MVPPSEGNEARHQFSLIVGIHQPAAALSTWRFEAYLDQVLVASEDRLPREVPVDYAAELRNYSSRNLEFRDMRFLFVPEDEIELAGNN